MKTYRIQLSTTRSAHPLYDVLCCEPGRADVTMARDCYHVYALAVMDALNYQAQHLRHAGIRTPTSDSGGTLRSTEIRVHGSP